MKLFEKFPKIETHPIGEFRMGAMGYGVTIRNANGTYDFLKDVHTIIGNDSNTDAIEISKDKRYFKVSGPDVKYILDSKNMKVSIYRITVRAESERGPYAWSESVNCYSEEHCIFGRNTEHIKGFNCTVYLQCPWVDQNEILKLVSKYRDLREKQLIDAINAL